MCGRFTLQIPPELLAEIFGLIEIPIFPAHYNITPSQLVAVIRQNSDGQNRLDMLHYELPDRVDVKPAETVENPF